MSEKLTPEKKERKRYIINIFQRYEDIHTNKRKISLYSVLFPFGTIGTSKELGSEQTKRLDYIEYAVLK